MTTISIQSITERWMGVERPLFKGQLISEKDGVVCYCAQGDVLSQAGFTDQKLRDMSQSLADGEVAKLLDIPRGQAVLLRIVNDRQDGCPQDVLLNPEKVIGDQAQLVIAFWRHLDSMDKAAWEKVAAARAAAWDAAWAAAWDAARAAAWDAAWAAARAAAWDAARAAAWDAAWAAAWDAAWAAAWDAARAAQYAVGEIMGAKLMRERGQEFFFLPMFGFENPEALRAAREGK